MSLIDARVELHHDGSWQDITDDVDLREPVTVVYGRPDEHSDSVPTRLGARLLNPDGAWSPKDPTSARYGQIGLGSGLRVRIGDADPLLLLPGRTGNYIDTPDHDDLDITADIDIRAEVQPDTWRPDATTVIAAKYLTGGDQRSWVLRVNTDGELVFSWSPDGTFGSLLTATSTAAVPDDDARRGVRVTMDVDNGSGSREVSFSTADSIGGSWAQLGSTVTGSTTSIHSGTAALEVGAGNGGEIVFIGGATFAGAIAAFELRDGIDGTLVADPDLQPGTEYGDDANSALTWTAHGAARVADSTLRGTGEITSWIPGWDETTQDPVMDISAAGIGERLGQGQEALRSSLYRDLSGRAEVVAYWPAEDEDGSAALASGLANEQAQMTYAGEVTLSDFSGYVGSDPIPTLGSGILHVVIPVYAGADDQRLMWLMAVPEDGLGATRVVMVTRTQGSVLRWDLRVNAAGQMALRGLDVNNGLVFDSGFTSSSVNGLLLMVSLWLQQDGGTTNWQLSWFEVGQSIGLVISGSETTTYGRFEAVRFGDYPGDGMNGTAFGHVAILNDTVHDIWDVINNSLVAWSGETAADRIVRLTGEAGGIPLAVAGDPDDSAAVGPQGSDGLLTVISEAADTDLGHLGESRDEPGLRYRTRASLYNQTPVLVLDMAEGSISNPFAPPLDNQSTINDITVSRDGGSSFRAVQDSGPRNIQDPVDDAQGVGRYTSRVTLSLHDDGQVRDQATWRLHLGTVDEHRIATLTVELEHHPDLWQTVLDLQQGDLIRVENPPTGLGPGPLDLIALGWSEEIDTHTWHWDLTCAPGSPWTVLRTNTSGRKWGSRDSTLNAGITDSDTSLAVAFTGVRWTTDPAQMPIRVDVGGEHMDVTAISGTTSPQTFTVTRSVNGVVKSHSAGARVQVTPPPTLAL